MQEKRVVRDAGEGRRSRRRGRSIVSIAVTMVMLFAFITPVSAQETVIEVSGNSVPSDCNKGRGAGAIKLSGDLNGCLIFFPGEATCDELNGFDRVREVGRELFIGKLFGERGRFRTKYTLEATFAPGFCAAAATGDLQFDLQLTGGCDHFVRGKRGAFEGMRGLITFFDVIPNPGTSGASNYFYAGTLRG